MTRSNQITISFGIEIGISVDTIQGTSAEKKIIAETDTTAMTNFTDFPNEKAHYSAIAPPLGVR